MKFDFGLKPSILRAIAAKNFKKPTEIQEQVIPMVLSGKDVIACSRTGSGKTLSYLLPILHLIDQHSAIVGARVLVIVPTRELALQTASTLRSITKFMGVNAPRHALIIGGHVYEGQFEELASNPDIIIATPGRLMEILQETEFSIRKVDHLVFDEADTLFEMGYREQLQEILNKVSRKRQTIMLSATMPESLDEFARAGLQEYMLARIDSEYTLSDHLQLHVFSLRTEQKPSFVVKLLEHLTRTKSKTIVFVSTRYWVEYFEKVLSESFGMEGGYLFGKMDQENRNIQLNNFRNGDIKFLIVTDLCARGLDIPEVDFIIHFDFPQSLKTFIHRTGRTARAEKSGVSFLLLTPQEQAYAFEIEKSVGREILYNPNKTFIESLPFKSFDQYVKLSAKAGGTTKSSAIVAEQVDPKLDKSKIYFGNIPEDITTELMAKIETIKKRDPDIVKLEEIAYKANQKFFHSRKSAPNDCITKSKGCPAIDCHFLFKDDNDSYRDFIAGVGSYRPKSSVFELKVLKNLPNFESVKSSIDKLKQIKNSAKPSGAKKRLHAGGVPAKQQPTEPKQKEVIQEDDYEIEMPDQDKVELEEETTALDVGPKLTTFKTDFRDKKFFISYDENKDRVDEFMKKNKIESKDVETMMLADDNDDFFKMQKQIWDKKKRKFKKILVNRKGERLDDDGVKQKIIKDKMNKLKTKFQKWKRSNQITIQKDGTLENNEVTSKAKTLFTDRRKQNFKPIAKTVDPRLQNKNAPRQNLKSMKQLFKLKKKQEKVKMINAPRAKKKIMKNKRKGK